MIINIENPLESTEKLVELIDEFKKAAEHNIDIEKYTAFLLTTIFRQLVSSFKM